jgi:hypothetical protein
MSSVDQETTTYERLNMAILIQPSSFTYVSNNKYKQYV